MPKAVGLFNNLLDRPPQTDILKQQIHCALRPKGRDVVICCLVDYKLKEEILWKARNRILGMEVQMFKYISTSPALRFSITGTFAPCLRPCLHTTIGSSPSIYLHLHRGTLLHYECPKISNYSVTPWTYPWLTFPTGMLSFVASHPGKTHVEKNPWISKN